MEHAGTANDMTAQAMAPPQTVAQTLAPSQVMHQFVRAATIRAVRTMAQTAASLMGAKALISDVDWKALVSATVMSGILSLLTSVYSGLPEMGVMSQPAKADPKGEENV